MIEFVWYLPFPARWIWCEIISEARGLVNVLTHDGILVNGLHKRRLLDAVIVEK